MPGPAKVRSRRGRASMRSAHDRYRLFAAAYIRNGANGKQAAREAGYQGSDHALEVTTSRLLKRAEVRAIFDAKVAQAEAAIGSGMSEAEILQRLTELGRADLSNFTVKVTPEMAQAAIEACGSDEERAKYALAVIEGRGIGTS